MSEQTLSDRVMKARDEERQRWLRATPTISFEIGSSGPSVGPNAANPLPTLTLKIVGGDPGQLQALGLRLAREAMDNLPQTALEAGTFAKDTATDHANPLALTPQPAEPAA